MSCDDTNFAIGNLADDMVELTLELCGKDENHTLRFPKVLYDSYVNRIANTALDIQGLIFESNGIHRGDRRLDLQRDAASKCIYLIHLIRIAANKRWISEKQRDRWQSIVVSLKWAIVRWRQSDQKTLGQNVSKQETIEES